VINYKKGSKEPINKREFMTQKRGLSPIEMTQKRGLSPIEKIGRKYNLKMILLYGSYASGKIKVGSDLDVAVFGQEPIKMDKLLEIHNDLADVFGDSRERELDLKSLHDVNPFFRFEVMRHSVLLYGNLTDYYSFKSYAFRDFQDSQSLFNLLGRIVRKRQKYLVKTYVK